MIRKIGVCSISLFIEGAGGATVYGFKFWNNNYELGAVDSFIPSVLTDVEGDEVLYISMWSWKKIMYWRGGMVPLLLKSFFDVLVAVLRVVCSIDTS
jgi:hypothetical protein